MRTSAAFLSFGILAAALKPAHAEAATPTLWSFGSFAGNGSTAGQSNCGGGGQAASLALSSTGHGFLVTGLNLGYFPTSYDVGYWQSLARAKMISATAGELLFDNLPATTSGGNPYPAVTFTGLKTVYSATAGTLSLSMVISIGGCSFILKGLFRQPT